MSKAILHILHFNDVYRVTPQKISKSSPPKTIDVTQFAALMDDLRNRWPVTENGKKDGLTLFSGDLFSPSVESSVTRGSHMVPVINELAPDVSLTGNHDFDFGYPHLCKLVKDTSFPWLLSNIIDANTSRVPAQLREFVVFERAGITIGVVGLVEEEWITTVASWPSNFKYRPMKETGIDLSKRLRDPEGEYKCDLIIALTHCRLISTSSDYARYNPIHLIHGVDIVLGGHDHFYYVSKGVGSWDNYDVSAEVLGTKEDKGDVLVIKSGTDFRDLSELTLELYSTPENSVRKMVIGKITGTRHTTRPGSRSSEPLSRILKTLLSSVSSTLKAPVCKTNLVLDVRSQIIRTQETGSANWFADVIKHAYDEALCMKGCGGADGVLICAGTLRGDSEYGPGMALQPIVVLEVDGSALWDALESALETWPAQEGIMDSRRPPGQRVTGVWLLREAEDSNRKQLVIEPIARDDEKKYNLVTREYMAGGHDGFTPFLNGQLMSSIVRKYLLGSQFVNKMARMRDISHTRTLRSRTRVAISEAQERQEVERKKNYKVVHRWQTLAHRALDAHSLLSKSHYQDHIAVSATEHMSSVDAFDGKNARMGKQGARKRT
ncbi:Metallo-dependent phosphatase-like protein [Cyathus striatus]|nr:Metallo-dependent phosphatase-like protein [Cyathus striatus]